MSELIRRIRIEFGKTEKMRFTSHLDLHRTWERIFRRAELPLVYSQGFNPRPKINIASALPLGFSSEGEILDFWLECRITPSEIQRALGLAIPEGLQLFKIYEVELSEPSLQSHLFAADYRITFMESISGLEERCTCLMASQRIERVWRSKPYDLRPRILALSPPAVDGVGLLAIIARLSSLEGSTGRPEEVVSALGVSSSAVRIHRLRLIFNNSDISPETFIIS